MSAAISKPVIFLAFANDRDDTVGYLRNLAAEARRLRDVLKPAEQAGLCEVVVLQNCTAGDIFKVFQDPRYRNRVGIFHYGGHANGYELLLESASGQAAAADSGGLARLLGQQQGLHLVFLNGCSTQQQTQGLLDANISVVISTSRDIDDEVATDFAFQFYQGLAGGASIRTAFREAEASVQTAKGGDKRGFYCGPRNDASSRLAADHWPWNLFLREGSEIADQWNLPEAVGDALFGLPPLPEQDLPESPYRHLNWFTRKDAEVFFGRGHQIRKLYSLLTAGTQPIILFYGQSGVGKSSLLDAGLMPRLEQSCEVRYLRRRAGGLLDTLQLAFLPEAIDVPIETAWLAKEEQLNRPLIVFLDQVEEFYTQPIEALPDELDQLLRVVKATFGDPKCRPHGKLVLGFRKEWLAELEAKMVVHELPRAKVSLDPLDRDGIIEVVQGPTRSARLRERYGLKVDDGLGKIIADDMLKDRGSAISTTLQILLSKMWTEAKALNSESPQFTQDLYQALERDGILLGDFFDQQLEKFHSASPEPVNSGLLLDVLALHTTDLGSAKECSRERLLEVYAQVSDELPSLLRKCQDLYLLTETASSQKERTRTTRLAHDTLAPLVRDKFDKSDKPGQRARRILDNRSVDWVGDHVGTPLDEADLKLVEHGFIGTRMLNSTEQRLVAASRDLREDRRRSRQAAEQQKIQLLQNLAEAEREKAKEQEARAVAEQERANAQEARATTFRRMLIAAGSATVVAVVLAVVAFNASNRSKQALADLKTESTKLKTESTEREAAALMAAFSGKGTTPTVHEYESLRLLADSDEATRLALMNQLLTSAGKSERLRDRYQYLLHAIVGLDVQVKERIKVVLSNYGSIPADDEAINVAVARLGVQLAGDDADFDKMVAMNFVAAMEKTTNPSELSSLADALGSLGEKLPEKEASALARQIVAAMENAPNYALSSFSVALGSLGEKVAEEQTLALAQRIVAVMENTTDSHSLSDLGLALGSFGENLRGEQATTGARQIVAAMEKSTEYYELSPLGRAFGRLGGKLPEKQASALAQRIVAKMENRTDSDSLSYLSLALGSLGEKLPGEQALGGAQRIVAVMEKNTHPTILSTLGGALGNLGEKLPADQALAGARQILAAMKSCREPSHLSGLGSALDSFGEKLPREQVLSGAKQIVAAMEESTEPYVLAGFGDALTRSFGKNLPEDQAFAGTQRIVTVMENTTDFNELTFLGKALCDLGEKLPEEHASALARRIIAAIGKTTGGFSISHPGPNAFYGLALVSLGETLPKEEALALAQQIVAAMEKSSDSDTLGNLGLALGSLGEKLPREQALVGAQHIVTAMEKKTDFSDLLTVRDLGNLGLALGSLGEKLPREQALAGAQHIVTAMEKSVSRDDSRYLVPALDRLDEELPRAQALALAQRIVAAMEKKPSPDLAGLSLALGSLVKNEPGEQASAGAQRILAAMEKTTDASALSSLGSGLGTLAAQMEVEATCSVLKSIVCAGDTQEKVLTGLEKKTGQVFDGNLWKAVTWLEDQGIDLKNVPGLPIISP